MIAFPVFVLSLLLVTLSLNVNAVSLDVWYPEFYIPRKEVAEPFSPEVTRPIITAQFELHASEEELHEEEAGAELFINVDSPFIKIVSDEPGNPVACLVPADSDKSFFDARHLSGEPADSTLLLDCDSELCVAWQKNNHKFKFYYPQYDRIKEPGKGRGYAFELLKTTDANGNVVYEWFDHNNNYHLLTEYEFKFRIALYFQGLIEYLYPDVFGASLPAGGGFHRWVFTFTKAVFKVWRNSYHLKRAFTGYARSTSVRSFSSSDPDKAPVKRAVSQYQNPGGGEKAHGFSGRKILPLSSLAFLSIGVSYGIWWWKSSSKKVMNAMTEDQSSAITPEEARSMSVKILSTGLFGFSFCNGFYYDKEGHIVTCAHCFDKGESQKIVIDEHGIPKKYQLIAQDSFLDIAVMRPVPYGWTDVMLLVWGYQWLLGKSNPELSSFAYYLRYKGIKNVLDSKKDDASLLCWNINDFGFQIKKGRFDYACSLFLDTMGTIALKKDFGFLYFPLHQSIATSIQIEFGDSGSLLISDKLIGMLSGGGEYYNFGMSHIYARLYGCRSKQMKTVCFLPDGILRYSAESLMHHGAVNYRQYGFVINDRMVVTEVTPKSAADQAGLKVDDIILAIDGRSVTSIRQLVRVLSSPFSYRKVLFTTTSAGGETSYFISNNKGRDFCVSFRYGEF